MRTDIKKQELIVELKRRMNANGFWDGQLSSSALSTAVAIAAFHSCNAEKYSYQISKAIAWLTTHINKDGGYGDTSASKSNISTTLLVYAALNLEPETTAYVREKISAYLALENIDTKEGQFQETILDFYQKDYTFSVPILTMCALCGLPKENSFETIPQLPFEMSLLPRSWYRFLNLSVVSYAIPALIAVGIATYKQKTPSFYGKIIRRRSIDPSLELLETLCPDSGGFLEAIPLTAFVALSLAHAGYKTHNVVTSGIDFLIRTQRDDGSWPIDIDLSTWVTTLGIKSFGKEIDKYLTIDEQSKLVNHLLSTQNMKIHPFNGTSPGGWGWTHFSGSVPDGDDTSGVIISLIKLGAHQEHLQRIEMGVQWLLNLQNNDGGFPTFSRGWGKLPFDQSCADITGHAILAIGNYLSVAKDSTILKQCRQSINIALKYLIRNQQSNGSWHPLWFGNQNNDGHKNPIYGTARVSAYIADAISLEIFDTKQKRSIDTMLGQAYNFLLSSQNSDASWGIGEDHTGTIEETALAITALKKSEFVEKDIIKRGLQWLDIYTSEHQLKASPIGLYFASLWYDETMYPLVAYLEAIDTH